MDYVQISGSVMKVKRLVRIWNELLENKFWDHHHPDNHPLHRVPIPSSLLTTRMWADASWVTGEDLRRALTRTSHTLTQISMWQWKQYLGWAAAILWSWVKVAQSHPTLCNPMDYVVHGILQARILEWVAVPFSRGSSWPRDCSQVSHIAGTDPLSAEPQGEAQEYWSG